MKSFHALLVIFLVLLCADVAAAEGPLHELNIRLEPEHSRLTASVRLEIPVNGPREVALDLAAACLPKRVTAQGKSIEFRRVGERLLIQLPKNHSSSSPYVQIDYQAVFADQPPESPAHDEDPSYGVTAAILPQGTFLSGPWYPLWREQPARYRVAVKAPRGYLAVTSGRLLAVTDSEESSVTTWETDSPLPSLALAAGPYRLSRHKLGEIEILAFFYPQSQALAATYLAASQRYLELYQDLFGPYPFEKFAVVENFFPSGYGFPSWTLLGSTVVRLPFIVETSLGHEIAHSWWGTGVQVDRRQGNWAEGLTSYVADHLYKERQSPAEAVDYRRNLLRDYATLVNDQVDFPLKHFSHRDSKASQAVGYGKATMVFHMLRKLVGETAFWEGLRRLATERMYQAVSWNELRQAFETTSGRDLQAFFRQWLDQPGAPHLELSDIQRQEQAGQWRVTGSLRQRAPFYTLEVPLRVNGAEGAVVERLSISGAKTPFTLTLPWQPLRLELDPDADLFRRLTAEEIPATINGIRGARQLLVVTATSLNQPTRKSALSLTASLRQEQAPIVSEDAVDLAQLGNHDLLFIGWPERDELRALLSRILTVDDTEFTVAEGSFSRSATDLFAALPHPLQPQRSCALFLPASAPSAQVAARKIPHYGKFSYLVFEDGENRLKGTWPPTGSAVIHEFPQGAPP